MDIPTRYKHAENKLYHQLHKTIDTPTELKMFNIDGKSEHTQKQLRQREEVSWRMHEAVDKVFRPQEQMTVEK